MFEFIECLPLDKTTHKPVYGQELMIVRPVEYTIIPNFDYIQAVDNSGKYWGCPSNKNKNFLTCNYCAKYKPSPKKPSPKKPSPK
ncbi:hypothetical protein PGT21_021049 [Puccinia graminis f. sp. tritici]|uniref:Uncharacterized protein n=1 Tax=Puccinia graminis f. sp. tritici TaxID=56615 RepID=A0A5B0QUP8_PUCGR|nr:hypothetical protein PGT21_021049 [Puccinia graminis f. sp. tritici]